MYKQLFLLLAFIVGSAMNIVAQDDLYFVPSKKKAKKQSVETYESMEYDNWADHREGAMDVDTYNRRGRTTQKESSSYYDQNEGEESFTNRIVRFHAPGITVVSSPHYTEYIDIYTDPWYTFYRPYGWYNYGWYGHYGWYSSWWWNDPFYWHSSWYDPWWGWHHHYHPVYHPGFHHGWYPHYGGHHHHHYYPSRTEHRRPSASNRGYRPSTERGTRPSIGQRPSQNRGNASTNRGNASTNRKNSSTNRNTVSNDRSNRKSSTTTATPSRTERPNRSFGSGGGGSRPQRSMGGGRR